MSFLDIEGKDLAVPYLLYLEEWGDFTIENDSVETKEINTLIENLPPHLMLDTILKVMSAATENAVKLIKEAK